MSTLGDAHPQQWGSTQREGWLRATRSEPAAAQPLPASSSLQHTPGRESSEERGCRVRKEAGSGYNGLRLRENVLHIYDPNISKDNP